MRQSVSTVRVLSYALLAVAVAAGTTGCFKRGVKGDYALAPEMRPLEVPPDLNLPTTTGDNKVPTLASATKPAAPAAAAPAVGNTGFTIAGGKDEAFAKVGTALAARSCWARMTWPTKAATSWSAWSPSMLAPTSPRSTRVACRPPPKRR